MCELNLIIVKFFAVSGAGTAQRYHQEKFFVFALTPQQVREVCISRYECLTQTFRLVGSRLTPPHNLQNDDRSVKTRKAN